MKTVYSTGDVHPRDAFDYWHEMLCKKVVRHDCAPELRRTFRAKLQSASFADVDLIQYESGTMQNDVRKRHVACANPDEYLVRLQIAGSCVVEQDSREAVLEAGDITLLATRCPMRAKYPDNAKTLILKVPRRSLEARVGDLRQMVARTIKPLAAEHGLLSAYMGMLPNYVDQLGPAGEMVSNQLLDLIAVSLAKAMDGVRARISSARSLALVSLRAAIEARLTNSALDAETVAAAAGISVRYANALLAEEGTSIMRFIQTRRLERCRAAIEDPLQAHRSLSEIAYGWGFSDMTHFGRRFRAAYGVLPSEYRRLARSNDDSGEA